MYLERAPVTYRTPWEYFFLGDVPNQHQALFWFDRQGPQFIQDYTRFTLLYLAIYVPIVATQFITFIAELKNEPSNIQGFVIYIHKNRVVPCVTTKSHDN